MKQIVKNTIVLLIITLVAGVSLACVREITKDPIKQAEEDAKNQAYAAVFPDAESFGEFKDDISSFKFESGVTLNEIMVALDSSGNTAGWVMNLTTAKGYGGDINIAVGIKNDGTLCAMTVISMNETAGLGAKCTSDEFTSQFCDIKADKLTVVKDGKDGVGEIDAISGATITTNAVTGAVNEALELVYSTLLAPNA